MVMSPRYSHFLMIVLQLCILIAIWFLGSVIQHAFNLPISAGVIGLLLLLAALLTRLFKVQWVKTGADFILAELVLLFIPCVVGLVKYKSLFLAQGWQLVLAVVLGTLCVMVITAYTVHLGFKIESRLKQRHHSQETAMAKHGK